MGGHGDEVRRARASATRISSVAGSPIASSVRTVKPCPVQRRLRAARGRRGRPSSPPTRAASARRSGARPSRRRRARAAARRRSAARARATCSRIVRSAGEFSTATRMRWYMRPVESLSAADERLVQQPDVQRGDDHGDRPGQQPSPRAGSTNCAHLRAGRSVNITSGKTANGSCRLRITWLRMSSGPVPSLAVDAR